MPDIDRLTLTDMVSRGRRNIRLYRRLIILGVVGIIIAVIVFTLFGKNNQAVQGVTIFCALLFVLYTASLGFELGKLHGEFKRDQTALESMSGDVTKK